MSFVTILGYALLIISPILGYIGWKRYQVLKQITGIEQVNIRDISESGPIELEGTIETDENTINGPFTKDNGVLSVWKIDEWDERGDTSNWATIAKGLHTTPFKLTDETGEVEVHIEETITEGGEFLGFKKPTQSALDGQNGISVNSIVTRLPDFETVGKYAPGEDPEHIKKFFNNLEKTGEAKGSITNKLDFGTKHGERKYYEHTLSEGDEIYLLGEVETNSDMGRIQPEEATIKAATDGLTVISTHSEEELIANLEKQVKISIGLSILLLPLGLATVFLI